MANIVFNYFLYIIVPLGIISFMAWKITSNKKAVYASLLAMIVFLTMISIFILSVKNNDSISLLLSQFIYITSIIGAFLGTIIGGLVAKRYTKSIDVFLIMSIIVFSVMLATFSISVDGMILYFFIDIMSW